MSSPVSAANQWLKAAIETGLSDASITVNVRPDVADEDEAYPIVLYSAVSFPAFTSVGATLTHCEPLYLVQAIGRADVTTTADLQAMADAIDDGIVGAAADEIGDWRIDCGYNDSRGFFAPPAGIEQGVQFRRRGGYYRLFLQRA